MPRFRDLIRRAVVLSTVLAGWSVSAADEPTEPAAAPAPVPAERPALPSRSDTMAADLVHQLPNTEFLSLKGGEEDFVALWRPANVGAPKGVIILVPGEGETADWPRGIGPLRRGLPDHGWHTLSLTLPDSPNLTPIASVPVAPTAVPPGEQSEAEEADETEEAEQADSQPPSEAGYLPEQTATPPAEPPVGTPEAETSAQPESLKAGQAEQIDERIEAALAYARIKQPAAIVLLGQGTGSYWAARYIQQSAPADVKGLLMIQPRKPDSQDEPLVQLVSVLQLATGDFFYKDGAGNLSAARERLNASRRINHPSYRQVGLPPHTGDRAVDQEKLLRRVRGWLDKQS